MLAASLLAGAPTGAQEPADTLAAASAEQGTERLRRLSIEELMEIDVTSVSKRSQPLSRAAAAITVLTREDLRRSGATSLPAALRLANGLHVAQQTATDWGITARGFNITTANKLLVLIDGRSVYTPLFSGVFWDVQDVLLQDVDRIEIIRGPGATLWGANAVNGVINIITRTAADTQGGLLSLNAGDEERLVAASRYGGELGERGHYRVYGKHTDRDALALADGRDAGDPVGFTQGGFRADWRGGTAVTAASAASTSGGTDGDGFTLQGDLYDGEIGRRVGADIEVDGANLLGRWERRFAGGSDLVVQAYVDRTHRFIPGLFEEDRDTWDLDLQHNVQLGARHNLVWGLGYRTTRDRIENSSFVAFLPDRRTVDLFNVFAQDEVSLLDDRLRLTLGAKLEHHESTGLEPQPSVRLAWSPDERQTFWGAVSRAVRAPTRLDEDVNYLLPTGEPFLRGDRGFESEKLTAYELGWRSSIRDGLSLDLSTFFHDYDDLRSQERTPGGIGGIPIILENRLEGETYGAEIRGNLDLTEGWRLHAAYAYLGKDLQLEAGSTDPTGGRAEGNDPSHRFLLRSQIDLTDRLELDFNLRHVDELPFPEVPSYTELDLRLGWQANDRLELSLVGVNLLDDSHPELGPAASREEVERSVYGRVLWTF
ncbi:MAG TPA: TonB-dependent receptor [Thermoanaerobaculia bacterium]|nr:TonB-dependent receptor [Thermoanaerobaculia bacterium]